MPAEDKITDAQLAVLVVVDAHPTGSAIGARTVFNRNTVHSSAARTLVRAGVLEEFAGSDGPYVRRTAQSAREADRMAAPPAGYVPDQLGDLDGFAVEVNDGPVARAVFRLHTVRVNEALDRIGRPDLKLSSHPNGPEMAGAVAGIIAGTTTTIGGLVPWIGQDGMARHLAILNDLARAWSDYGQVCRDQDKHTAAALAFSRATSYQQAHTLATAFYRPGNDPEAARVRMMPPE